jgi:flagellar biosynthesis protein FlhG
MEQELKNNIWAIGGGKGGAGKSITTILLGSILAKRGKKVLLVDADLGGSNLHAFLGIRYPAYTIVDFIQRRVDNMEHIIVDTSINNLMLVCGADDIPGLANPKHNQKLRILHSLKKIDADYILLDLGAGTSYTALDFFLYAPNKIVVLSPLITSLQNAYGFIKCSLYRYLSGIFSKAPQCLELVQRGMISDKTKNTENMESIDELKSAVRSVGEEQYKKMCDSLNAFTVNFIVNNVRNSKEANISEILKSVTDNYLGMDLEYLGHINFDPMLDTYINELSTYLTSASPSISGSCIYDMYDIATRIMQQGKERPAQCPG